MLEYYVFSLSLVLLKQRKQNRFNKANVNDIVTNVRNLSTRYSFKNLHLISLIIVSSLSVFDSLQVAIAQFSDDARTEFQLSSHENKEALLEAIQKIRYKGGNTKTGLNSVVE